MKWAVLPALLPLLSACSMFGGGPPSVKIGDVRVQLASNANFNSPVILGVVLVADRDLEKRVMSPDRPWFEMDAELAASYPAVLRAYRCELTGGQEMRLPAALFKGQKAYTVVLVATLADADRRARIDGWRDGGLVTVERDHWEITPGAAAAKAAQRPAMQCISSERAL